LSSNAYKVMMQSSSHHTFYQERQQARIHSYRQSHATAAACVRASSHSFTWTTARSSRVDLHQDPPNNASWFAGSKQQAPLRDGELRRPQSSQSNASLAWLLHLAAKSPSSCHLLATAISTTFPNDMLTAIRTTFYP
jgi:hypothetical protein